MSFVSPNFNCTTMILSVYSLNLVLICYQESLFIDVENSKSDMAESQILFLIGLLTNKTLSTKPVKVYSRSVGGVVIS